MPFVLLSASRYTRYRRPSTFFTIGEVPGGESDEENYNELDLDESGPKRKISSPIIYSSNSSLESEDEMAWELSEGGKRRRESIAPATTGLQQWVNLGGEKKREEGNDLLSIGRKKKLSYEEIKELVLTGKAKEAKAAVRDADWDVGEEIRSRLWPLLATIHEASRTTIPGFYEEQIEEIFGTQELPEEQMTVPSFVDEKHRIYYGLSEEGKRIADRIVCVLGSQFPDITFAPLLLPITSLFLHYASEEKTYECISTLLSTRTKLFISQTKLQSEIIATTAIHLTKKFSKSTFNFISKNTNSPHKAEPILHDWIWWIFRDLPIEHLTRVMDCFLMEGMKVLYRVGIAILLSFTKASDSTTAKNLETLGFENALSAYCRSISISPQRLLKTSFSIRAFRGSEIKRITLKVELILKSGNQSGGLRRLNSLDNAPSSQSQHEIQMLSHTLAIKEGHRTPEHRAASSLGHFLISNLKSSICKKETLLTIWSWLPQRVTMYQPILLYTSDEHGCSLTTFFNRVEAYEPTILIIKTTGDEVFGAYCSTSWATRNMKDERGERQRYFGTGETFLFSLEPQTAKYSWVGIKNRRRESGDDGPKLQHGEELFMHADTHLISIGGGEGQGICLDEDLRFGKSEECSTFKNPPLTTEKDFEVRVIEVFGFVVS